jgi:hypothetical protein
MPGENPNEREFDVLEAETLYLLTETESLPSVWSISDLGRQLDTGDPGAVVRPLVLAGLLNRTSDGYVFATPAAFKWVELVGRVA